MLLKQLLVNCQKNMQTRAFCRAQRLPRPFDVLSAGASQRRNARLPYLAGDSLYRGKVAIRCDGKAGFDYVDAKTVEYEWYELR